MKHWTQLIQITHHKNLPVDVPRGSADRQTIGKRLAGEGHVDGAAQGGLRSQRLGQGGGGHGDVGVSRQKHIWIVRGGVLGFLAHLAQGIASGGRGSPST